MNLNIGDEEGNLKVFIVNELVFQIAPKHVEAVAP